MQMHKDILLRSEIKEKIAKEYTGKNQKKLAEKYNIEFSSVCHFLAEKKVKGKKRRNRKWDYFLK